MRPGLPRGDDVAHIECSDLRLGLCVLYIFAVIIIASFSLRLPMAFCRWPLFDRRWPLVFHHLADFLVEASGNLHEAFEARAPHPAPHAASSFAQDAAQLAAREAPPPISNSS